jgi:hemolysin III
LAGALLALLGTAALLWLAVRAGDGWRIVSFGVYGASLVAQYVTSFLYHSAEGAAKARLRHLDHCAIYLLIAGTYSPFTLVSLRGHWGWPLFAARRASGRWRSTCSWGGWPFWRWFRCWLP